MDVEGQRSSTMAEEGLHGGEAAVNAERDRYPYCLVWTPIPCLTWLLPFVGHMGICSSKGITYDFAGPFYVSEDDLAFGKTTRYLQLAPSVPAAVWDAAVQRANACYRGKMHNLCFQNCHSHCATVLCDTKYKGFGFWNMMILAVWMFFCGRFVSVKAFLWSVLPSIVIYGGVIGLSTSVGGPR